MNIIWPARLESCTGKEACKRSTQHSNTFQGFFEKHKLAQLSTILCKWHYIIHFVDNYQFNYHHNYDHNYNDNYNYDYNYNYDSDYDYL